jgi:hypothetical protein
MSQVVPNEYLRSGKDVQLLVIFFAVIVARAITVSCGLTPKAVGKTLASQTYRFSKPNTLQSESTTHSSLLSPILFPPCGCAEPTINPLGLTLTASLIFAISAFVFISGMSM